MHNEGNYEYSKRIRAILSLVIAIPITISLGIKLYEDIQKFEVTNQNGTIIECSKIEKNTIWSFIGLSENIEYKTVVQVGNKALESSAEEIYYMCKDKEKESVDLKVKSFNGNAYKIDEIIEK